MTAKPAKLSDERLNDLLRDSQGMSLGAANATNLKSHIDYLTAELSTTKQALADAQQALNRIGHGNAWTPDVCPITGREFFGWIKDEHGQYHPTYGDARTCYTIPVIDAANGDALHDRDLVSRKYDHDLGGWTEYEIQEVRLIDDSRLVDLLEAESELKEAQQALAAARAELTSLQSSVKKLGLAGEIVGKECESCKKVVAGIMFPNGAVLLEEHDCINTAPAKPAASEPADDDGMTDWDRFDEAQQPARASDPPERRFVCPRCGCRTCNVQQTGDRFNCQHKGCGWSGDWPVIKAAEVEAAKGEGEQLVVCARTVDGKPLSGEQARELQRFVNEQASFEACPTMKAVEALRLHFGFGLRQFAEMCGVKPLDWSDLEHGRRSLIVDVTLETALTKLAEATKAKEQQLAAERQAREAAEKDRDAWKKIFEAQNGEIRKLSDAMADHEDAIERLREIGKAIGCDHVGGPDERRQIVNCVEQTVQELEQRAADAEAAFASMKEVFGEVVDWQGIDHEDDDCPEDDTCTCKLVAKVNAVFATAPGQAANELRKLKAACQMVKDYYTLGGDAFEAKYPVRPAEGHWRPCFMDIVDQALSQAEQRGEGR